MEERFFLLACKSITSKKGTFQYLSVYDNVYDVTFRVFVDGSNYDYFKGFDILSDITRYIDFSYDNKSGQYRLSILRKE